VVGLDFLVASFSGGLGLEFCVPDLANKPGFVGLLVQGLMGKRRVLPRAFLFAAGAMRLGRW
jgi:hypothetical protein